jgi:flagellar hook-associated protein 2
MNGLQVSLTAVTTSDVTVNVSANVDEMYDKISDFVDKYNDMMGVVNGIISQKKDRDFDPLTSKEKEDLSETEIETYEKKAKVGVISGDTAIQTVTAQLRNAIIDQVGSIGRLNDIGIMNAPASGGGKLGKLELDEDKLKAALADDPDKVMDLFFKEPEDSALTTTYEKNLTSAQVEEKRSESGIFNRISDILSNGITSVIGKAGYGSDDSKYREVNGEIMLNFTLRYSQTSTLDGRSSTIKKTIESLNEKMKEKEDYYYQMFATMESALSKLNSQSAWIQSNMM